MAPGRSFHYKHWISKPKSNAYSRAPDGHWRRIWTVALVIALIALSGLEGFWRGQGFEPAHFEQGRPWAEELGRALSSRPDEALCVVGSSKSVMGVDPRILARVADREVHMLAINGGNPLPVLEQLAERTSYRGSILLEFMPSRFFSPEIEPRRITQMQIDRYDDPSPIAGFEALLRRTVGRYTTVGATHLSADSVAGELVRDHHLPGLPVHITRPDRFLTIHIDRIEDVGALDARTARELRRQHELLLPGEQTELFDDVRRWRERVEQRGGSVFLFVAPTSGQTREVERELYPRAEFYERARREIGGRWWHFEDDPRTAELRCFDGVHLVGGDVNIFTTALARHWTVERAAAELE